MKPITFPSRGVSIDGWEQGQGHRVMATHGWLDNANTWLPVAQRTQSNLLWRSIDFPGHGRSGHGPKGETYHFVDYVEVLLDAADQWGWDRFSLVGHSMGGSIAMMFAAAFPERVDALVLSDSFGPLTGDADDVATQLRRGLLSRRKSSGIVPRHYPAREDLAERIRRGSLGLTEDAIALLLERTAVQTEDGWAFSYDPRVRDVSTYRFLDAHVDGLMRALACPTLMIRASHGGIMRHGALAAHFDKVRDLRIEDVEGNHHVHLNDPDSVAPLIEAFLLGGTSRSER